jgi:hemerythrin-like domain-containing protein
MTFDPKRRTLLRDSITWGSAAAIALPLIGQSFAQESMKEGSEKEESKQTDEKEPEVTATEDLMREHGVIRRALLVYYELIPQLRQQPLKVNAAALQQTAKLFRTFGEDYHERMLEEQHIFPMVRKHGPEFQKYVDTLTEQHNRGREITDYVLAVTKGGRISSVNAKPLASVFESFVLMYENHAAREDTIVFPAWKKNFSDKQLDDISDQFEEIEHKMFGRDGFDDAEKKISGIENELGFGDLSKFTAPSPPRV